MISIIQRFFFQVLRYFNGNGLFSFYCFVKYFFSEDCIYQASMLSHKKMKEQRKLNQLEAYGI